MKRRWASVSAAFMVAVLALAACSSLAPATCSTEGWDPQPALTCDAAIAAARTQLATTAGVSSLRVEFGGICPPNARCAPPEGTTAAVIATLANGAEVYILVSIGEDGQVRAEAPAPMPTFLPEG